MNPAFDRLPRARLEEALAALDASIRALEAQAQGDTAGLARLERLRDEMQLALLLAEPRH